MSFSNPLSKKIWQQKYCCHEEVICDQNIEESWHRIAKAISQPEKDSTFWEKQFYSILEDFKFLPGGRIQAGAGLKKHITLMNCFVMNRIEDSIEGIFQGLKEGAHTMQYGGGIGYDFSTLRPQGSVAEMAGTFASGPVSFMKIWDKMCEVMLSTSYRRGAMMANLRCDHPDVVKFIEAKHKSGELTNFNLSVLVTDKFLQAVKNNQTWQLVFDNKVFDELRARELWQKIITSSYEFSEPGVLFIDKINDDNNLNYCEKIYATNPCGEVPLPPFGACNLGSINLTQFIEAPFSDQPKFNFEKCFETLKVAQRFLDNVLDVTDFPLEQQKISALNSRRIGLGVTGLASSFAMLNIKYGTEESFRFVDQLMSNYCQVAYEASIEVGREKGVFPLFSKQYGQKGFASHLPEALLDKIKKYGLRNSHLLSIAPTGTISVLANNVSSGIEPIFKYEYLRKVIFNDGQKEDYKVKDFAVNKFEMLKPGSVLSEHFVESSDLTADQHLQMVAHFQKYVDQSISKTINLNENSQLEDVLQVYEKAYDLGLKGCTTYRPSLARGAVLS
ncbi:MAG: adenosylcobalamin-dependent ribonucleoside-diphosphate reductase [Bdellovibrionales bacterium]|nr:adenosylcobalamin-dependent ribonucleoside-diphosphate reductase [Bdellovibrionales bacterium]